MSGPEGTPTIPTPDEGGVENIDVGVQPVSPEVLAELNAAETLEQRQEIFLKYPDLALQLSFMGLAEEAANKRARNADPYRSRLRPSGMHCFGD